MARQWIGHWALLAGAVLALLPPAVAHAATAASSRWPDASVGAAPRSQPPVSEKAWELPDRPWGPRPSPLDLSRRLQVPRRLRLMVFAPHPDDETLAAAGLIQRVAHAGGEVRVVFMTNGDGFPEAVRGRHGRPSGRDYVAYGRLRHAEAVRALQPLGIGSRRAYFLGFPDGGLDHLWGDHWAPSSPYLSPFTRSQRPPYRESWRPRVDYDGAALTDELARLLRAFSPDWVVLPDPRDRHPDHASTGVFVLEALAQLEAHHIAPFARTQIFTYLVHYPDYPGTQSWLQGIGTAGVAGTPTASAALADTAWVGLALDAKELRHKRAALTEYRSQMKVMPTFLELFLRPLEIFGHLNAGEGPIVARDYAARFGRRE